MSTAQRIEIRQFPIKVEISANPIYTMIITRSFVFYGFSYSKNTYCQRFRSLYQEGEHIMEDEEYEPDDNLLKSLTEYWGRRKQLLPPEFPENEIVVGPYPLKINVLGAGYVPSFPKLDAIIVASNGTRQLSEGGYIKLPAGNYKVYYVDRHDRYTNLPDVKATTSDGASITISFGITYNVHDPIAVHNVRNPLDALFKGCEAAIRHITRTHKHDEMIGEQDDPTIIQNSQISDNVKLQVNLNEACRAFSLLNVNVIERQGHARLLNIREEEAVQQRAGKKEIENTRLKTQIATEQRDLFVSQGALIEQQAINEKNRREILFVADKLTVELEKLRQLPRLKHEEILKIIDARSEALKSLIQAQAMPGFPRNAEDLHLVDKIVSEMPNISLDSEPSNQVEDVNELSSTLIQLMIPKKR
jgi:hypothetical protein